MAKKIIVGRAINGISLNGNEYLLDDETGKVKEFESREAAVDYLFSKGMPLALIHGDYFCFEETDE